MAQLGFRTVEEMIGRVDRLEPRKAIDHWKAQGFDFSQHPLPAGCRAGGRPLLPDRAGPRPGQVARRHHAARAVQAGDRARREGRRPSCRSATSTASSAPSPAARSPRSWGAEGLPEDTDPAPVQGLGGPELRRLHAAGHDASCSKATPTTTSARASPAARSSSIRRRLRPSCRRRTSSSATWRSTARPAARPTSAAWRASGSASATAASNAVVEAVGDHGCEYMTGGRVVVLGPDGPQLRRRHVRRHRLRARRSGRFPRSRATSRWSASERSTTRRRSTKLRGMIERHCAATPAARARGTCWTTGTQWSPKFVQGHAQGLSSACSPASSARTSQGLTRRRGRHGRVRRKRARPRARRRRTN